MELKKKKHIALISSWYPSRIDAFNGDFVQRHAKAISILNKVSVMHVEGDSGIRNWELVTHKVNEQLTEYIYYFPKSRFSILNFVKKIIGLIRLSLRLEKFDIIHANVVHFHFLWLLFQSTPYIITEHATQYQRWNEFPYAWLKKIVFKPIFQNAHNVLTVSQQLGEKLEQLFGKLPIIVIPNVIDEDIFYFKKNNSTTFTFLHISNLSVVKNIPGILEACLHLHKKGLKFSMQIGGNGPTDLISEFIKRHQLELTIKILPALPHSEVAKYMQEADCFVLFSHFENQPCVLAEAMACGLPFISSNVGGVAEFLPPKGAIIIPKNNLIELASAMTSMMLKTEIIDRKALSEYAVNTFSKKHISQKINKIYNDCLNVVNNK